MDSPDWLPQELDSDVEWDELEDDAYRIFVNDFIKSTALLFKDKPVKLDYNKDFKQTKKREKSFYHLVKKTEDKRSRRVINDPPRAIKIGWIRPLIENYSCKGVLCWDYWEFGVVRTYIWIVRHSYVIILQEEPSEYVLISGYYVDRDERLCKKFKHRIK